jgi:hypothetical protein
MSFPTLETIHCRVLYLALKELDPEANTHLASRVCVPSPTPPPGAGGVAPAKPRAGEGTNSENVSGESRQRHRNYQFR